MTNSSNSILFAALASLLLCASSVLAAEDFDLYYPPLYTSQIAYNDLTPSLTDMTDWGDVVASGGPVSHSFRIKNNGNENLVIVSSLNSNTSNFTVTGLPLPTSAILPGNSHYFSIAFDPSTLGLKTATIQILTGAPSENPFIFAIRGTSVDFPEIELAGRYEPGSNWIEFLNGDSTPFSDDGTFFVDGVNVGSSATHTFRIRNTGNAPLTNFLGSATGAFSLSGLPVSIAAGGSNTFSVTFTPTTFGVFAGTISISSNDVDENPFYFSVRGTGLAPDLGINGGTSFINVINNGDSSPRAADGTDFGSRHIDDGPVTSTFRLKNWGNASLLNLDATITGEGKNHFSVTGVTSSLAANATDTFTVSFNPSTVGNKLATLEIASNDPDEDPYTFAVQGIAFGNSEIEVGGSKTGVSYAPIANGNSAPQGTGDRDFGNVPTGTQETRYFRVSNPGTEPLTLSASDDSARFSIVGLAGPIAPGGSDDFTIVYSPFTVGTNTARITITNNTPTDDPFFFDVTGTCIAPNLFIYGFSPFSGLIPSNDTTPVPTDGTDFGDVGVDLGAVAHSFELRNTGNYTLNVASITMEGTNSANFFVSNVPSGGINPGGNAVFSLSFDPSAIGLHQATVVVNTNDPSPSNYRFAVRGTGVASSPDILVRGSPSGQLNLIIPNGKTALDAADGTLFSAATPGSPTDSFFTITNGGLEELTFAKTSSNPQFTFVGAPVNSLAPDTTYSFYIRFTPTQPGQQTCVITIANNDPDDDPYTFEVGGTGITPDIQLKGGAAFAGIIDNNSLTTNAANGTAFGDVLRNSSSISRVFRIENSGNGNLAIISASLSGSSDFTLTGLSFGSISPGDHEDFTITFDPPSVAGLRTASMSIKSDDPEDTTFKVHFDATGVSTMNGPDVAVSGSSASINSGDTNPSSAGDTDFGSAPQGSAPVAVTYFISNPGDSNLLGLAFTSDHPDVSFSGQPSTISPGGKLSFTVNFSPNALGQQIATISIASNDPNENPFTFAVRLQVDRPATEPPAIIGFDIMGTNGSATIETMSGKNYTLKTSKTLAAGSWFIVPGTSVFSGTGGPHSFTFSIDPLFDLERFYRVEVD